MSTVVVVPWWPDTTDPWRSRWRDEIVPVWIGWGYPVVLGLGAEGAARNRGIEEAIREHDAHTIIVCDADSIIRRETAAQAVEMVREQEGLVVPHDRYVYLGSEISDTLGAEGVVRTLEEHNGHWPGLTRDTPLADVEFWGHLGVGGPTVFSVDTWEQAGGYDEQIIRAYDGAFALACGSLVAPQRRIAGDYVHLWHVRFENEDPPETWATIRAYHAANEAGPGAMRDLVNDRKP